MNSTQIKTDFQIKHLVEYLNKFIEISVNKIEWHKGFTYITFSDNSKYSMTETVWHTIQQEVERFYIIYKMTH